MLERSRIWVAASKAFSGLAGGVALALSGCATTAPAEPAPSEATAPLASAVAQKPPADPRARAEEARALVAQAETDIQRARARRALWSKAWEALVGARAALAADDAAGAILQARRASELAQLGLEQLAYPAVKTASRSSP
jgi:hypothetical protein